MQTIVVEDIVGRSCRCGAAAWGVAAQGVDGDC